jgi:ribosomal protein L29
MAGTKAQSLREKTDQELEDQLILEKKRLFDGVVKSASGESIKPHEKRGGRRLVAKIKTILSERRKRAVLQTSAKTLEEQTKDASPEAKAHLKKVEERLGHIKAELGKAQGSRKLKPFPARVKRIEGTTSLADRRAVKLAETKRLLAALEREDVGQKK